MQGWIMHLKMKLNLPAEFLTNCSPFSEKV
jgi:hypothetical protein